MHGPVLHTESSSSTGELRMGYVWWIAVAAALGGLLFGYDWVVIGGAREFYEIYFHLTSASLIGWANSCALLGCLAGSLLSGALTERWGRQPLLLASAVLFAISSALTGLAHAFEAFIVWRIVGGIAIGLSSNVSPMYIAEISPAAVRGRLVTLNQFAIVVGILIAQIANLLIARPVPARLTTQQLLATWNVQWGWRWMFIAVVLPSIIFMICTLFLPESPRWLLKRGHIERARKILGRIGGTAYAEAEISAIEKSVRSPEAEQSSWSELFKPSVRKALWIAVGLAVLQQWTGINILFNYAAEIYRRAGYGNSSEILLNIVITGAINLIFTVLAMFLVDSVGRRKLMLFGCVGIAASHLLCALAYRQTWPSALVLCLTLSAIACYAATLAPVTWVLISELFPNSVRTRGISISVSALWIASFVLTYTFPLMNEAFGTGGTFLGYGVICLAGFWMVYFGLRETKGRSLEEM